MAKYPLGLATRFKSKRRRVTHRRKARGVFHPLFLRGTHKRRRGAHRPVVIWTGSKFRRPKRSRLFPHPARINPRHRRAHRRSYRHNPRRSYRRNPLRLPMGIDRSVMAGLPVAGGIALSMFAMPQIAKYLPAEVAGYGKFFGVAHVLLGVVAMAFVKKDIVKTLGGTVVAMGIYDLIACNIPQLNLPPIPGRSEVNGVQFKGYGYGADEIVGAASFNDIGRDFAPAGGIGSSYGASYGSDDIDYGGDDIEIG